MSGKRQHGGISVVQACLRVMAGRGTEVQNPNPVPRVIAGRLRFFLTGVR